MTPLPTQSFVYKREIDQNDTSSYFQFGNASIKRRFSSAIMPNSASWNEIWIGLRWSIGFRTGSNGPWSGSGEDVFNSSMRFAAGICVTSQSVFGDSGSISQYDRGTAFLFGINAHSQQNNIFVMYNTPTGSRSYGQIATSGLYALSYLKGKFTASTGISNRPFISFNSNPQQDSDIIFRFVNKNNPVFTSIGFSMLFPTTSSLRQHVSQSFLPEFMKQNTWDRLTGSAGVNYSNQSFTETSPVNWTGSGGWFPDGMFISWNNHEFPVRINDVVVRII